MIVDSVLTSAKAHFRGEIVDCCLSIDDGKIQKIGKETNMPRSDHKIDLGNLLVLPGVVDSHVHLRDEGNAYKETFTTGTAAAAAGGVTTVLDMPNNSPITMSKEALNDRMQLARRQGFINVGFYSEFPTTLEQIQAIVGEGAVGFKLFMAEKVGGLNIDDDQSLKEAFEITGKLGVPVAVHAEDHTLIKHRVGQFKLANRHDLVAFLKAHDEEAEFGAIERLLNIMATVKNARVHFCHVSTEKALRAIAEAKVSGKSVTCEVTPHHLLLTKEDYERLGTFALTLPPLRTRENVLALWRSVKEGTVDTIGSDHAPHTLQEKNAASVWDIKAGVPGLETTLPLILTVVHKNRLSLTRAIQLLSEKPAEIFQLHDRGHLEPGKNADLAVVDFNAKWIIDASKFKSKAKFSPFDKWEVQGKPVKTFVNGQLVLDEGEIVTKPGIGKLARRL